ncbi:MAG TPA: SPOR domain-containing protein [Sphingomicrobium sp.]|nr:SPOR domain-containing protein [Sphingomicrobium sp.]
MAKSSFDRVRVAALILSGVGLALAASVQLHAQAPGVLAISETASAALARHMRTLATSPKDFHALIGAGRAALELGDTQAAVGFFGRADEVYSRSPLPQAGMGAAAVQDGDAAGALTYFARAQQLGATAMMIGAERGLAYDLLGRHADAQADYRAALSGSDGDEARRRLALSLAITGKKDEALAILAPLAARGDSAAARCRALVLAVAGDAESARRLMDARMPGSGAQMDPFFRRLPVLRSDQKAAAVHLGIFPGAGQEAYAIASAPPVPSAGPSVAVAQRVQSIDQWLGHSAAPAPAQPQPAPAVRQQPVPVASAVPARRVVQAASAAEPAKQKVWLQLASGSNAEALPSQFQRLKSRNRDLLEGISGYIAEEASKVRLLIGPFRNRSEAEMFAEDLGSARVSAFSWTNPPDVAVRKLSE